MGRKPEGKYTLVEFEGIAGDPIFILAPRMEDKKNPTLLLGLGDHYNDRSKMIRLDQEGVKELITILHEFATTGKLYIPPIREK